MEAFDVVPGSGRLEFEFTGSSQHPLSVDPAEYKGLPVVTISETILRVMSEIAPGVNFTSEDMELAATAVAEANGE